VNEQEEMERWRRRMLFWGEVARFFKESVMIDVVSPILGAVGLVVLFVTRSDLTPAWVACVGALGLTAVGPAIERIADLVTTRRGPPE